MKPASAIAKITGEPMTTWYKSVAIGPTGEIERWDVDVLGARPSDEEWAAVLAEPEPEPESARAPSTR